MIKIMFVCHGNICRSPMAEFVFRDLAIKRGVGDSFYVSSSATSTEEIGNSVYPPARRELLKHGIDPSGKVAVQLERRDYDKYNLFVGMDSANFRNMHRIFGADLKGKIIKLLDLVGGGDVADPWYTGNFELTYRDVHRGCEELLNQLLEK